LQTLTKCSRSSILKTEREFYSSTSTSNNIIAIRREDKNKWERRVPLTPEAVKVLRNANINVVVQPSTKRIFSDDLYAKVSCFFFFSPLYQDENPQPSKSDYSYF